MRKVFLKMTVCMACIAAAIYCLCTQSDNDNESDKVTCVFDEGNACVIEIISVPGYEVVLADFI